MTSLYITADKVGIPTGGGIVTANEAEAFKSLGPCEIWDRDFIGSVHPNPWGWDDACVSDLNTGLIPVPKLAHFYAGTFSRTIDFLKRNGTKVTYTAAAHDIDKSRREHEILGIPFNYPHLTDPEQWKRYVAGYLAADVLICPSQHSASVMRKYGATGRVEIVPHGVNLPERIAPLPDVFRCGYLGAFGPDKGVRYLLEAWKRLNYKDATLVLAGRDSTSPFVQWLVQQFGGGNIELRGWIEDPHEFYSSLSVYIQPSVTEGFGCEVLESMSHGRPVVCSDGAGASDMLENKYGLAGMRVPARDVSTLVSIIDAAKKEGNDGIVECGRRCRKVAEQYTWDKIRQRYVNLWRELL